MKEYIVQFSLPTEVVIQANSEEEAKQIIINNLVANKQIKGYEPIDIKIVSPAKFVAEDNHYEME